jgi:DNA-binding response OmpR family regulator
MSAENRFALIIEDDEDLDFIFSEALRSACYLTEIVRNGNQALAWLKDRVPEIVLLDLHLPGALGVDILNFIRAEKRLAHTKVIVTSGDRLAADQVSKIADVVLIKPISFTQLRDLTARFYSESIDVSDAI